jgi:hypothetical protein
VRAARRLDETPLLHVAEMVFTQIRMTLEDLTARDCAGTRSGHCATHYTLRLACVGGPRLTSGWRNAL